MKEKDVFGLTLDELNFSTIKRLRAATRWLMAEKRLDETPALIKEMSCQFNVKDIIHSRHFPDENAAWVKEFKKKIIKLGLSQLDWLALPNETVTPAMLRAVPKKNLEEKTVLLLGTLSPKFYRLLFEYIFGTLYSDVVLSIKMLLQLQEREWRRLGNFDLCVFNTKKKLLAIGFEYPDGIFLQEGTHRQFIDKLMATEEHLSRRKAGYITDIAFRRNWIRKTPEWNLIR